MYIYIYVYIYIYMYVYIHICQVFSAPTSAAEYLGTNWTWMDTLKWFCLTGVGMCLSVYQSPVPHTSSNPNWPRR